MMILVRLKLVLLLLLFTQHVTPFIPASLVDQVFSRIDKVFLKTLDIEAETTTHDDIIKFGISQSIVEYFYNQTNGTRLVNRTLIDGQYYDLRFLYRDYYGVWLCGLDVDKLIKYTFKPSVAIVDLDPRTKDMPYAHFDAETFVPSNQRVMNFTSDIFTALAKKKYDEAQTLAGQIMHTIQDFYSHSNWIEMGKNDINYDIGFENFTKQSIISGNDTNTCTNNCTLVIVECGTFLKLIIKLIDLAGFQFSIVSCPLTYWRCNGNILVLNKLLSGYYGGQKLPNGQLYSKPNNLGKCSHGGMFDKTANETAQGGINKDSGYYIVSPHAHLHASAVKLAIKHTKYYFENIRNRIGDREYAKFLNLELTPTQISQGSKEYYLCAATAIMSRMFTLCICIFLSISVIK